MTVAFTASEVTLRTPPPCFAARLAKITDPVSPVKEVVHTISTVRVPPRPQADWHAIYAEDRE